MMHFVLIGKHFDNTEAGDVRVRFAAEDLNAVLRGIELFLRGCGFQVEYEELFIRKPGDPE